MKSEIKKVCARQILDSRGNPALYVEAELEGGIKGGAGVPSGASVGAHEALELRDKEKGVYFGRGVLGAVNNVNAKISKLIEGACALEQKNIDEILIEADGTENKSNLGANAILGVSLAVARAAAKFLDLPLYKYLGGISANTLPVPMVNIINGGAHADNTLDFQEFMITPTGADSFHEGLRMCAETFHCLKTILKEKNYPTTLGDEGGFAPDLKNNREALDLIIEAISRANYTTDEIKICLDVAASELYREEKYIIKGEGEEFSREEMAEYLRNLSEDYPIISIEDGMAQEDYQGWQILTAATGKKILLVGDDLFVTNSKLLNEGIENGLANAILIKPNQIGTLTETLETIRLANLSNYKTIVSHRSGETCDSFIADLAAGLNTGLIKTGSVSRGERVSKYNRLLEIEAELNHEFRGCRGDGAKYYGLGAYFKDGKKFSCKTTCPKRG